LEEWVNNRMCTTAQASFALFAACDSGVRKDDGAITESARSPAARNATTIEPDASLGTTRRCRSRGVFAPTGEPSAILALGRRRR